MMRSPAARFIQQLVFLFLLIRPLCNFVFSQRAILATFKTTEERVSGEREREVHMQDILSGSIITTYAGDGHIDYNNDAAGRYSGDGGPAESASLSVPLGVAVDSAGNVFIADSYNNRIRLVTKATGIITTYAGCGTEGFSGDGGAATSAALRSPCGVAVDSAGNVFIADTYNNRIRLVTKVTGIITTYAGGGQYGQFGGDGVPATIAALRSPRGVAVDSAGNVFISDNSGEAVDSAGNVFIAETSNRIRMVTNATGIITTYAGGGMSGFGEGVAATSASLSGPSGLAFDSADNLFIADTNHYKIRLVMRATGIITTYAGDGYEGFLGFGGYRGDGGAATSGSLRSPRGVAVDSAGNVFIADQYNHRIRLVTPPPPPSPTGSPSVAPTPMPPSLPPPTPPPATTALEPTYESFIQPIQCPYA